MVGVGGRQRAAVRAERDREHALGAGVEAMSASVLIGSPVAGSHSSVDPSAPPAASVPFALNATALMPGAPAGAKELTGVVAGAEESGAGAVPVAGADGEVEGEWRRLPDGVAFCDDSESPEPLCRLDPSAAGLAAAGQPVSTCTRPSPPAITTRPAAAPIRIRRDLDGGGGSGGRGTDIPGAVIVS